MFSVSMPDAPNKQARGSESPQAWSAALGCEDVLREAFVNILSFVEYGLTAQLCDACVSHDVAMAAVEIISAA